MPTIMSSIHVFLETDTFPTSENQSRGLLSSVSDEIIKLIPSVLNELAKVGKENVLQMFFSQVSCSRFPLNNIAFQLLQAKFIFESCGSYT